MIRHCTSLRSADDFNLAQWVNGLKRSMSVALGATKERSIGNRDFSITFCGMMKVMAKKWEYVQENPVRARLVQRPDQWPH